MQSSSESGRVAYCLPIGISSSKSKCVRLSNGRSLQYPKQASARAIVDATGRTILVLYSQLRCIRSCIILSCIILAIALCKNFPQNVLVSSSFWSPRKRRHGPCMYDEMDLAWFTYQIPRIWGRHVARNFDGGANNNEVSTYIMPLVFLKHHPQKVHFPGAFILNNHVQIEAGK